MVFWLGKHDDGKNEKYIIFNYYYLFFQFIFGMSLKNKHSLVCKDV